MLSQDLEPEAAKDETLSHALQEIEEALYAWWGLQRVCVE